jgi:cellulose synthase/poly-beta-1,6-N-acetylglucosamine synthase-like glycosyltransferase
MRRNELLRELLQCLGNQTHQDLEVLIVRSEGGWDHSGDLDSSFTTIRRVSAPKGLAPARNKGLAEARGEIVCFLDDDVLVENNFFETMALYFNKPELRDVGGMTAYDMASYPQPVSPRWRARNWLGITPSLRPGDNTRLGRSVPLSFFERFSGCRDVKWLPGFCHAFRREAIQSLSYDEHAVVEDRDFSMEVGRRWRLVICGDLHLEHRYDPQGRHSPTAQIGRAAFGLGRSFAKRRRYGKDWLTIFHVLVGECLIDLIVIARWPTWQNCKIPVARVRGYFSGLLSLRRYPTQPAAQKASVGR